MSSIITFYSYKGGVGRSMALANIAVLLAERGCHVLVVDWDLEAPGLERYFAGFDIKPGGPGLLRMFMEVRDGRPAAYETFTSSVYWGPQNPIILLASGREHDEAYSRNLEAFNWEAFFTERGGAFIEELRHQWRRDFDVVLVDSRTGLSDTGGICTIQLPDIVVAMFTANYQSLYGVRDVMRLAQKARQSLAYDRMPLSVLPLPSRWGVQEFQETQLWLDRVAEAMQEFYEDWLPRPLTVRQVVERTKVPQSDYFGFGEKLAVIEQGTADPLGMGFVYDKVASFLASDFRDVAALVGTEALTQSARNAPGPPRSGASPVDTFDYLHDVFISHDRSMPEFVLDFTHQLKAELTLPGGEPKIFVDLGEIPGDASKEQVENSLLRSRVLLAMVTPRYNKSPLYVREWLTFAHRQRHTGSRVLLPVIMRGDEFPAWISEFAWLDLREFANWRTNPSRRSATWHPAIDRVASLLRDAIAQAPPYDPKWAIASPPYREVDVPAERHAKAEPEVSLWPVDLNLIIADPEKHGALGHTVNMTCRLSNDAPQPVVLHRLELAVTHDGKSVYHLTWHLFYSVSGLRHLRVSGDEPTTVGARSVWQQGVQFRESSARPSSLWPAGRYEFELRGWIDRRPHDSSANLITMFRAELDPSVERQMQHWATASAKEWTALGDPDRAVGFPILVTGIRSRV